MPAGVEPSFTREPKPEEQENSLDQRNENVAMKAAEEGAQNIGQRGAGRRESQQQHESKDEPKEEQREEAEGGETVAGALPGGSGRWSVDSHDWAEKID